MVFLEFLSLSVNILCLIQKLPQIYRIYQTKNVDSVSTSSVLLEETAYTLILTYNLWRNYPLSAFFEYIFLFVQDLLLLWALSNYSVGRKDKPADRSRPIYGILIACFYVIISLKGFVPDVWLSNCTMFVIPIGASAKLIQLRTIVKNKSSGQVSRTGWAIATYSNAARIITNLFQTNDMKMVLNLSISFILNSSVVIACTIYANKSVDSTTNEKKTK